MEQSILTSTKKILGIDESYTIFDLDVTTHINAAFAKLNQLGVGPEDGYSIEDDEDLWTDYDVPLSQLSIVKTYIYLSVRMAFDPPTTSFLIEATNDQLKEYEWRLSVFREGEVA